MNEHGSPPPPRWNEDAFTEKIVTPLLSPFFSETKHLKQFGCEEESEGSKGIRESFGRKSDGGLKIKSPSVVTEDQVYHPDFTKLGNLMKDEVDLMIKKDFPEDVPVFGILVGGHHASVFVMDLVYTKVYRLFELGSFLLPHNAQDLSRLDGVFDTMAKLSMLISNSAEKCLKVFRINSSPGSPTRRRQVYVKSFISPRKR